MLNGFYERHQADLQGYPGGQKAFEEISLNTYMRDQLSKASKQDDQGNYVDQRTAMLIGIPMSRHGLSWPGHHQGRIPSG